MDTPYNEILENYPSTITLDQFYRICHICKRKAKWLLENGIVPCQDSGKKTRRFKIQTIDVVYYLQERELHPDIVTPPVGLFNSGYHNQSKIIRPITSENLKSFKTYLANQWSDIPDILNIHDISKLTGYQPATVLHWISSGKMKSIIVASKRIVAKEWLIDYLSNYTLTHPSYLSDRHKEMISDFIHSAPTDNPQV